MYLNGHIQVIINGKTLDSVISVETHNDGNHIGSYCEIVLPLNSRIENNDTIMIAPTRFLFNTGDHIIVNAKYDGYESLGDNGNWQKVFEGFLYDFYETTPIKIKCFDFIYWFNMGIYGADYVFTKTAGNNKNTTTGKHFKEIEFSDLLQDIVSWVNKTIDANNTENKSVFDASNTDKTKSYVPIPNITLIKPDFSFKLVDITFSNISPAACLEWLKRELGFNITLIDNQLYANIASFTRNQVKLDTSKNVIQSNMQSTNLTNKFKNNSKGANSVFLRIKLTAYFENEDGTKNKVEVGDPNGQLREVFFYKVKKEGVLNADKVPQNYIDYANEALIKCYQSRYTGEVETYLYPKINLFDRVTYSDARYVERNGDYVATLIKTTINEHGYHRTIKLASLVKGLNSNG